jgi:hypothetical protein
MKLGMFSSIENWIQKYFLGFFFWSIQKKKNLVIPQTFITQNKPEDISFFFFFFFFFVKGNTMIFLPWQLKVSFEKKKFKEP